MLGKGWNGGRKKTGWLFKNKMRCRLRIVRRLVVLYRWYGVVFNESLNLQRDQ